MSDKKSDRDRIEKPDRTSRLVDSGPEFWDIEPATGKEGASEPGAPVSRKTNADPSDPE